MYLHPTAATPVVWPMFLDDNGRNAEYGKITFTYWSIVSKCDNLWCNQGAQCAKLERVQWTFYVYERRPPAAVVAAAAAASVLLFCYTVA